MIISKSDKNHKNHQNHHQHVWKPKKFHTAKFRKKERFTVFAVLVHYPSFDEILIPKTIGNRKRDCA